MNHGKISKEIAAGLAVLRKRVEAAKISSSKLGESFSLATWNIREFGGRPRLKASLHYIAEIIGHFDLVSVVELRDNMADLRKEAPEAAAAAAATRPMTPANHHGFLRPISTRRLH